jgi:hypothetical protein
VVTLVDISADSGGFLVSIAAAVDSLRGVVSVLSALVEVLIVAACVLIAVEVARGVMRR